MIVFNIISIETVSEIVPKFTLIIPTPLLRFIFIIHFKMNNGTETLKYNKTFACVPKHRLYFVWI